MTASADDDTASIRVWDLPTRLFHWTLACVVTGSVISAQIGGNAMVWHFRFGYAAFTLLAFRLLWGFVGGRWSRFASFVHGPGALRRYLRGERRAGEHLDVGHNPLGSLSVYALLGLLVAQVATGLVADDEISNVGPLNRFVSDATASRATAWHTEWGQWLIYGVVALHVAAIAYYRLRRGVDLVRPMLSGDKTLPAATPAATDNLATRLIALLLAALCAAAVAWVVSLGG
ncbi:MAG: cytochrome B [Rubrivivax sp. SCN 70-15]|nr:MAG: cytochrome B [Rubrivivax sp. SCN 70-15]